MTQPQLLDLFRQAKIIAREHHEGEVVELNLQILPRGEIKVHVPPLDSNTISYGGDRTLFATLDDALMALLRAYQSAAERNLGFAEEEAARVRGRVAQLKEALSSCA